MPLVYGAFDQKLHARRIRPEGAGAELASNPEIVHGLVGACGRARLIQVACKVSSTVLWLFPSSALMASATLRWSR